MADDTFDYVIVGAGAAGSALASRLSEDPAVKVLLLESGGGDWDPLLLIPKGFYFLYGGTKHSFVYKTKPAGPHGTSETWQRGRVLGGSTAINGLQWERGGQHYWDSIAEAGNEGWGWNDILTAFRAMENHELGASETRGAGGPVDIRTTRAPEELNDIIFAAAENHGLRRVEDVNATDDERVGFIPNNIRNGFRLSAARAFLDPASKRKNLTILRDAHVSVVLFDGRRAVGVRARHRGMIRDFRASREVVLSAGAIESPLILERSGIGRSDILARIGVPQRVESPNVGEHAVEQRQLIYQARITKPLGYNRLLESTLRQMISGAKFLVQRSGVIGTGAYDIGAFYKSDPDRPDADGFAIINPLSLDLSAAKMAVSKEPGFSAASYPLHPTTESSVHSSGSEPTNPPVIEPHYLETEYDRKATLAGLETVRGIAAQSPLADIVEFEETPGPDVTTMEDAVQAAWTSGHILHATGTLRMGPGAEDAVDSRLRVRGVEGLRVADVSVLPRQPGNTMAPGMAVGWKAADILRADHQSGA